MRIYSKKKPRPSEIVITILVNDVAADVTTVLSSRTYRNRPFSEKESSIVVGKMKFQVAAGFLLASMASAHGGHHHHNDAQGFHNHEMHHGFHNHEMHHGFHNHMARLKEADQTHARGMMDHHGGGHPHHDHHAASPQTDHAYHHVEQACARDVEQLCTTTTTPQEMPNTSNTLGDPFLDWVLRPSAGEPSPMDGMEDVNEIMDRMLASILTSSPMYTTHTIYFLGYTTPQEEEEVDSKQGDIDFVVDSTTAKLARGKAPEELPELADQLQSYGKNLMTTSEEGMPEHHLGRRLTEMDVNTLHHRVHLPFGCKKNSCLINAFKQGKTSLECSRSIEDLEFSSVMDEKQERQESAVMAIIGTMAIMCASFQAFMVAAAKRAKRKGLPLGYRIIQTVYSNPKIKNQVEAEMGESIGDIAPRVGARGGRKNNKALSNILIFGLLYIFFPPFAIAAVLGYLLHCVVKVLFFPVEKSEDECQCCCCGATPSIAAAGGLSEAQECCNCCKGTGACSIACKSCCGDGTNGCSCCCCGGDGCCCPNKASIVVKDDCTCCCCGATPSQAKDGTLTAEQECCNCCKGTGKCSDACAACCGQCCCCGGNGCCCCAGCCCAPSTPGVGGGQKHIFQSKKGVYEGVPVQIV
eukprot:scaffold2744_cov136-Cylindrotheca_fusiformis.AAC.17